MKWAILIATGYFLGQVVATPRDRNKELNPEEHAGGYSLTKTKIQRKTVGGRIVGGTQASPGEFPFYVDWNGCGASLIHSDILLSAAHCNKASRSNTVYVGAFEDSSTAYGAQKRTIVTRQQHPNYVNATQAYDFVILKLGSPVTTITPIPINSDPRVPASNQVLTVVGLGDTSYEGSSPDFVRKVNVNYIDTATCNAANSYDGDVIDSVMFCAGVPGGGKDSCQGDSGGPIFTAQGVQVGVVSWGIGCADRQYPGIYSRISGAIGWINQQVCSLSANPPSWCNGSSPTPPVSAPTPSSTTVTVSLELYYDAYPTETSWDLFDSDLNLIDSSSGGNEEDADTWTTTTFQLTPGATYLISLYDSDNDGFCCDYGQGEYYITATINGKDFTLASGSGDFTDQIDVTFIVPNTVTKKPTKRPTRKPTKRPTKRPTRKPTRRPARLLSSTPPKLSGKEACEDDPMKKFAYSNGQQTCSWLMSHPGWIEQLCVVGEGAYDLCPKTCGHCKDLCTDDLPLIAANGIKRKCG